MYSHVQEEDEVEMMRTDSPITQQSDIEQQAIAIANNRLVQQNRERHQKLKHAACVLCILCLFLLTVCLLFVGFADWHSKAQMNIDSSSCTGAFELRARSRLGLFQ
jgi:hypothetical protein